MEKKKTEEKQNISNQYLHSGISLWDFQSYNLNIQHKNH